MEIQIKHGYIGLVLFEHECVNNTVRLTVELAVKTKTDLSGAYLSEADLSEANLYGANLSEANLSGADLSRANLSRADLSRANLSGAYLSRANLSGAYLSGANLSGANLSGADLSRANLSGANLSGADLSGANLSGANLSGADLCGAYLSGANLANGEKLVGTRPVFQIGPIGSRCAYFTAYITDRGHRFDAGCQRQITRETFVERLGTCHGENEHAKEYLAALALIDAHAEIWTPKQGDNAKETPLCVAPNPAPTN